MTPKYLHLVQPFAMTEARIVASVDNETKQILEETARRQQVSISALLRMLAVRISEGRILL